MVIIGVFQNCDARVTVIGRAMRRMGTDGWLKGGNVPIFFGGRCEICKLI